MLCDRDSSMSAISFNRVRLLLHRQRSLLLLPLAGPGHAIPEPHAMLAGTKLYKRPVPLPAVAMGIRVDGAEPIRELIGVAQPSSRQGAQQLSRSSITPCTAQPKGSVNTWLSVNHKIKMTESGSEPRTVHIHVKGD
jgi:hypothetical protein